jgi:hypothetical protein
MLLLLRPTKSPGPRGRTGPVKTRRLRKPGEGDDWQPNSDGRRPNPAAEIEKELREKLKRAAAEDEQHLKTLDSSLASRVRKLRRLDPYADIEELVERAREAQREADSDKTPRSKGSWWRRS